MKNLKTTATIQGLTGQITIHFYLNNNMPALLLENLKEDSLISDLTTNHRSYLDKAIAVRSDQGEVVRLLKDCGWITGEPLAKTPSGFITIDYYQLTDAAYSLVIKKAKILNVNYPKK